jgi:hypothetical protein
MTRPDLAADKAGRKDVVQRHFPPIAPLQGAPHNSAR